MGVTIRTVQKMLAPLRRRIALLATRAFVEQVNDGLKMQGLQITIMDSEVADDVEHFQPYGFTARPFKGAEGIHLALGGSRAGGVVICVADRRYRLTGLAEGEVAIYDDQGSKIHLKREGKIEITAVEAAIIAELIKLGQTAADALALASKVDANQDKIQQKFDGHGHTTTATIGPSGVVGVIAPPSNTIGPLPSTASGVVLSD